MRSNEFFVKSWRRFPYDPELAEWVGHSVNIARQAVRDPNNARWLRCDGTWFVGVNALPNDTLGSVADGPPLSGQAVKFIRDDLGLAGFAWDRAQVSVCYPGYPRQMSESKAAFRYRRDRDAAHVDGLLPEGAHRRRHLREHHSFILGIPMLESNPKASPFVVWEGSHEIVREKFIQCFEGLPPEQWGSKDITNIYHELRRQIFDRCRRVEVWAQPGESYIAHRLALHGVAPWSDSSTTSNDGRMICYFRPEFWTPSQWLNKP